MPVTTRDDVAGLLKTREYVIIQGPPGTGKTRMAREMLEKDYGGTRSDDPIPSQHDL